MGERCKIMPKPKPMPKPKQMIHFIVLSVVALSGAAQLFAGVWSGGAWAAALPPGMVYLRKVAPTIQQDMRYAGRHNFLARRVRGYLAAKCIVTRRTAKALRRVQRRLMKRGLSLKVYDCYRPLRAVEDFLRWARRPADQAAKAEFYPTIAKQELFDRGYISERSTHTLGNTVDVTLVPLGSAQPRLDRRRSYGACHLLKARRAPDNSLDFGTGYDCFHRRSGEGLDRSYRRAWQNRRLLDRLMRNVGFHGYRREWWHFTLRGAGAEVPMNFPVQ